MASFFCYHSKKPQVGQMEAEEALRVLRAQYHDFLNNLQIISGLMELGHPEKLKAYVRRAADEFIARGNMARMGIPAVAWALLRLQVEGVTAGVRVGCSLEKARDSVEAPKRNPSLAAAGRAERWEAGLHKLHKALIAQASGSGRERFLDITGKNADRGYVLTYSGDFTWEDILEEMAGSAGAFGIGLALLEEKKVEVLLDCFNETECSTTT